MKVIAKISNKLVIAYSYSYNYAFRYEVVAWLGKLINGELCYITIVTQNFPLILLREVLHLI